jgi:hypothetical protein
MAVADRIVIWRFREVTYGLTRKETEFLRDCLVAHSKADWLRLGVWLRRALNAPETALPVEFSPFDVPALRGVLDGVMVGSSGLAALQHDVGARPHPEDPSARAMTAPTRPPWSKRAMSRWSSGTSAGSRTG